MVTVHRILFARIRIRIRSNERTFVEDEEQVDADADRQDEGEGEVGPLKLCVSCRVVFVFVVVDERTGPIVQRGQSG